MPFIYDFNLVVWAVMCAVLYWAYRIHWGRPRPEDLEDPVDLDDLSAEEQEARR